MGILQRFWAAFCLLVIVLMALSGKAGRPSSPPPAAPRAPEPSSWTSTIVLSVIALLLLGYAWHRRRRIKRRFLEWVEDVRMVRDGLVRWWKAD